MSCVVDLCGFDWLVKKREALDNGPTGRPALIKVAFFP